MGSASVFVRKATDALHAALALEGSGDDDGAFALYPDAIRDLTCAAAFEQRGSAFTEAQRGSIAVIQSRRAQLERRLQAHTGVARSTLQQLGRAQLPTAPELAPQGPTRAAPDMSLDAPILGHEKIKSLLREAIILPQLLPKVFNGLRTPLRTLLLHGPPGTGKTMLARSIVAEASRYGVPNMEFITVPPSLLLSKFVGESEKQMADVFKRAKKGDGIALLLFDEVDSFALQRGDDTDGGTRRLLLESLLQLSDLQRTSSAGEHRPVIVVAATNARVEELDASFVRRFERQIEVPLPDAAARELMLRHHMKSVEHSITDDEFEELSSEGTRGHSGCDIASLAREAAMRPVREFTSTLQQLVAHRDTSTCTAQQLPALEDSANSEPTIRAVTYEDFLQSLSDVTPSCGAATTAGE